MTSALMFAAGKVSFRASRRPGREGRVRTSSVTMSGCRREMLVPGGGGGRGMGKGGGACRWEVLLVLSSMGDGVVDGRC